MELEEYIKDATDEAMSDYIKSEKYKEHKKQINDLLRNMRENLSSAFFYSLLLSSVLFFNAIPLTTPRR